MLTRVLLPAGADRAALPILIGRSMRSFADGYIAVLLPAYLYALGYGGLEVGFISTATLIGSALATMGVGVIGHRYSSRGLLLGAAWLMAATGIGFAGLSAFWPLLLVAFIGTLNPSSGDVSIFLPLEQARLAEAAGGDARTALFARYTLVGLPQRSLRWPGGSHSGVAGAACRRLQACRPAPDVRVICGNRPVRVAAVSAYSRATFRSAQPAGSAGTVARHRAQAGGAVQRRCFCRRIGGQCAAGDLAVRPLRHVDHIGGRVLLLGRAVHCGFAACRTLGGATGGAGNTMVFTHIPANICLILAALAPNMALALGLLLVRSALSQMDVPTRTAFVMAVVTPGERAAAASFTSVPRSLASSVSPSLGGALLAAGSLATPLVICGAMKIAYDIALLLSFRRHEHRE